MKWLSRHQGLFVFLLLLFSSSAWADGKVFARAVAVTTPDQRAMLYYSNGVEKLVIETSFLGEGTNFAWVIPFPSAPKIQAVSTNFFPLLSQTFQPKLIHTSGNWPFYLFFGVVIAAGIWSHRTGRPGGLKTLALFILFLLLFAGLALPNFVRSRGVISASASVSILNEQQVGLYNTVTLSGPDGQALSDWLNTQGFYTPTNALPVISKYANEGWVFVAASLNRTNAALLLSRPHPLAFTFSSTNAVYPLRLTGVENGKCEIELFVFGPGRASVAGFEVSHCGKPLTPNQEFEVKKEFFAYPEPGEYRLASQELQDFTLPAAVVTKLTGNLGVQDMQSDVSIEWDDYSPAVPTLFTRAAVKGASLDWFFGIVVMGALSVQIAAPRLRGRMAWRTLMGILLAASVCGLTRWSTAKSTEVKWIRGGWFIAANEFRQFDGALQIFNLERKNPSPPTFPQLQTALTNYCPRGGALNCFTLEPIRNEATPGNVTLKQTSNGVDVLWYDVNGGPHWLTTFKDSRKE